MGISWSHKLTDGYAIRISDTGGFIINSEMNIDDIYLTQSGHGTIILGEIKILQNIRFEDERWLDNASYALPEDQVMYYKAFLQGNKISSVPVLELVHLDASTTLSNNRNLKAAYGMARNITIFWDRFIFKPKRNKLMPLLGISRRIIFTLMTSFGKGLLRRDFNLFKAYCHGYIDGIMTIRSKAYNQLPTINSRPHD